MGVFYPRGSNPTLVGYSDLDWVIDASDRRSTSRYVFTNQNRQNSGSNCIAEQEANNGVPIFCRGRVPEHGGGWQGDHVD
uniref:Uncharacterized protein n=1 Tax=Picea glauca TaxID=3330 RepID=A0A101LWZ9_PICGL|nr:hypothetical protein ABT39_MTgene6317 [Picea glauca]